MSYLYLKMILKNFSSYAKAIFVVFLAAFSQYVYAQEEAGKVIEEINVAINGPKSVAREAVLAHIRLRKGDKFNQTALDGSIKSLYETGQYDLIVAKKSVNASDKLVLDFNVTPKYRIAQIAFNGNKEYSARKLQSEIDSYAGAILDEVKVKRDADKIKDFYVKKGYALAKVDYSIERNDEAGKGAVVFNIDEGADVKIQNIRFTGDPEAEQSYGFWGKFYKKLFGRDRKDKISSIKLKEQMKTDTWITVISHLTDNGRFKEEDFKQDLEALRKYYRNLGYLDVEIDESKVKFEFPDKDSSGDMDIVINIVPNAQYKIGKTTFKNNKLFKTEKLIEFVDYFDLTDGNVFSPENVDKMVDAIKTYYGEYGHIDTIVRALRRPNLQTGNIDLIIDIIESEKFYLESIKIQGNTKTKSEVIIRELALAPGEIFDLKRMKQSENRLKETRFFEEVSLSPEASKIPGRKDLRIVVKEGRTGNITFGAGFSTVESLVGTVELTQGNFDYSNPDNMFQGAGQKFRLRGSLGLESSQIVLNFEEPWVFNRVLAYGFELYRSESDYYSDYYSETRLGMQHYLRKRIYEKIDAKLAYKIESVDIDDVNQEIVQDGVMSKSRGDIGSRSISQVSLSFLRDTRDSLIMPTSGARFEILNDLAGGPFMGDTDLYRFELRAGWWTPTFEFGNQVFSAVARLGTVMGLNGEEVPYFEKFFLGGGYNLRGFKYRKVGRLGATTEEPFGGDSFGFASLEYSIELFHPVRFAVFYDVGFLNEADWDFDPSDYNSDFGFGLRIVLMGAPMRIDVGFPLTTGERNDDGMQFNFSFGTVF